MKTEQHKRTKLQSKTENKMFFKKSLDLANLTWKANLADGNTILQGPQKYETIPRSILKSFELIYKGKIVFNVKTYKKTLVHRLKTTGTLSQQEIVPSKLEKILNFFFKKPYPKQNKINERVRITAILEKNSDFTKNIKYTIKENGKTVQEYEIDPSKSTIYYYRENRKTETINQFGDTFPYSPIKLRDEEMIHLNG